MSASEWQAWSTEAAMVADFCAWVEEWGRGHRNRAPDPWTVYPETGGWDLVLVRQSDGFQIGAEAKLSLNAKVLCQVIEHDRGEEHGSPDVRAILVPEPKTVTGMATIARALNIQVIIGSGPRKWSGSTRPTFRPDLPERKGHLYYWGRQEWPERAPDKRVTLPDYVPDVPAGVPSPVALTTWKVAAIKAVILMEVRGRITRADFRALGMNPSRWTQWWLRPDGDGGWLPAAAMPDFKAQHPVNYEQIKADFAKWAPPEQPGQPALIGGAR